ncbi:MAG: redoxin domain-containing protein [Terracidiphilus sp.]
MLRVSSIIRLGIIALIVLATLGFTRSASCTTPADVPNLGAPAAPPSNPAAAQPDQPKPGEPTNPKAVKAYASARDWEKHRDYDAALSDYRKAFKLDAGCWQCLERGYHLALKLGAYKDAIELARQWLAISASDAQRVHAHLFLASALQTDGIQNKKDKSLQESADEFKAAFDLNPKLISAHYQYGVTLARLHQDEAARAEFTAFLDQDRNHAIFHPRAERFLENIELARAKMAPPFALTTLDGQRISMDGLAGKVVLIDFWATWCGPCREALPHIQSIAKKFDGQPFVVLSVSLDGDDAKWKTFVEKNGMTWLQYRDGGFNGSISKQFNVTAIPATFTIDADGVLEDQHVGDASIEGKLKKLIAIAANRKPAPEPDKSADSPE